MSEPTPPEPDPFVSSEVETLPHVRFASEPTTYLENLSAKERRGKTFAVYYSKGPLSWRFPVAIVSNYVSNPEEIAAAIADILNREWIDE